MNPFLTLQGRRIAEEAGIGYDEAVQVIKNSLGGIRWGDRPTPKR